jgi:hypothetical protein
MDDRMQDAVLKAARAVDDVESLRAKLKHEHAVVVSLTKQLDTVTARSQRLARAYQRSRLVVTSLSNGAQSGGRGPVDVESDGVESPPTRGVPLRKHPRHCSFAIDGGSARFLYSAVLVCWR